MRLLVAIALAAQALAQTPKATIEKLVDPIYPPIAKAARVSGDVDIALTFNPGAPVSAAAVSGPPMLHRAALESASQSTISCDECFGGNNTAHLLYSFQLISSDSEVDRDGQPDSYPRLIQNENHITLIALVIPLDTTMYTTSARIRSPKCLYLWHCSSR